MYLGDEWKKLYKNPSRVDENLLLLYDKGTSQEYQNGKSWYENANSFSLDLAKTYKLSAIQTSGIISAMSPQKRWGENKILAENICQGHYVGHTSNQVKKAELIVRDVDSSPDRVKSILSGLKTQNFFMNIFNPKDKHHVTIDTHHMNACFGKVIPYITDKQYLFLHERTCILAKRLNLLPSQFQGVIWLIQKRVTNAN